MGVVRDSKIFRAAIYMAHRAVVFAIARLSCLFVKLGEEVADVLDSGLLSVDG